MMAAATALILVAPAQAQSTSYRALHSDDPVADANAYLLTLIAADPAARAAVNGDPAIQGIGRRLADTRTALLKTCRLGPTCPVDQLMLTDSEIDIVGVSLSGLALPGRPLARLVRYQMRPSGRFQKYADLADAGMVGDAWAETARGVNRLFRVYADGDKPRYPAIDSIGYPPNDAHLRQIERIRSRSPTGPAGRSISPTAPSGRSRSPPWVSWRSAAA